MPAWTREEVVKSMAKKCEMSQKYCRQALNAFLATVEEAALNGEDVRLQQFGNFQVEMLPERESMNPWTREKFIAPPKRQIRLKLHQTLKDSINRNIPGRGKDKKKKNKG